MNKFENKWIRAAIPALLMHCSIGTVRTNGEVEWAFSIAIFVLGMSAAFCGKLVERYS